MSFYTVFKKIINFFELFKAYADYQKIDFPFSKSANVSKLWKTQNVGDVASELPHHRVL